MIIWIYGLLALESHWSEMWHFCQEFQKHGASDISSEAGSFLWCKEMLTSCVLFLKGLFVFRFQLFSWNFLTACLWWQFLLFLYKSWNLTGCHRFKMCVCARILPMWDRDSTQQLRVSKAQVSGWFYPELWAPCSVQKHPSTALGLLSSYHTVPGNGGGLSGEPLHRSRELVSLQFISQWSSLGYMPIDDQIAKVFPQRERRETGRLPRVQQLASSRTFGLQETRFGICSLLWGEWLFLWVIGLGLNNLYFSTSDSAEKATRPLHWPVFNKEGMSSGWSTLWHSVVIATRVVKISLLLFKVGSGDGRN